MQDFSDRTLRKIKALIRAERGRETPDDAPLAIGQQVAYVTITGPEDTGYFPGKAVLWNTETETWDEFGDVWAFASVGTIEEDGEYLGIRYGDFTIGSARPVFVVVGAGIGTDDLYGLRWQSDTTSYADPASGDMLWNHATQGSATRLYFSSTSLAVSADAAGTYLLNMNSGFIHLWQADDPTRFQVWRVTGRGAGVGSIYFTVVRMFGSDIGGLPIEDNKVVFVQFYCLPDRKSVV